MNNQQLHDVLLSLIAYIREVADLIEAAQTKLQEGFTMDETSHTGLSTDGDNPISRILKTILQDTKDEDQSMEDNISFMLGSIHKRTGKYKHIIKDTTDN
ncbi:unnamed protein product [Lactuca saligna]|uniref:Uncharacterized protein n=1 Tax=Lactuca saligna TaxID=75948 RepID=A0AA35YRV8_LACSI|nr:unnamed protein product [Lactuca saligna]